MPFWTSKERQLTRIQELSRTKAALMRDIGVNAVKINLISGDENDARALYETALEELDTMAEQPEMAEVINQCSLSQVERLLKNSVATLTQYKQQGYVVVTQRDVVIPHSGFATNQTQQSPPRRRSDRRRSS